MSDNYNIAPPTTELTMGDTGSTHGVPPEDVLAVFEEREDGAEPLTAPEIADALGASRRTVFDRLDALHDRGAVASKKVGARGRVWWVPDEPAAPAAPLKRLVGMLDAEEAGRFEQRTGAVRERFDREVFGEEPGRERGECDDGGA
jgi:biotin operon repressor